MTTAEMLEALEEVMGRDNNREGFYTTAEIARTTGMTIETVRSRLQIANAAGRLETKKVREPGLGGMRMFTCYRIGPAK